MPPARGALQGRGDERQCRRHGAGILGPSQVAGILVERTENQNLTATRNAG